MSSAAEPTTTPATNERVPAVPPGRRGWLVGMAIVLVLAIALIAFMATRGGSADHGDMPGMNMQSRGAEASAAAA